MPLTLSITKSSQSCSQLVLADGTNYSGVIAHSKKLTVVTPTGNSKVLVDDINKTYSYQNTFNVSASDIVLSKIRIGSTETTLVNPMSSPSINTEAQWEAALNSLGLGTWDVTIAVSGSNLTLTIIFVSAIELTTPVSLKISDTASGNIYRDMSETTLSVNSFPYTLTPSMISDPKFILGVYTFTYVVKVNNSGAIETYTTQLNVFYDCDSTCILLDRAKKALNGDYAFDDSFELIKGAEYAFNCGDMLLSNKIAAAARKRKTTCTCGCS